MIASMPLPADERLAAITRRPQIHVVTLSTEHDVAVRRAARRCAPVRSAQDDVVTLTAVHHVVAIQSKHDIVALPAFDNVGAVERLIRNGAGLDRRVILPVVILPDQKLRPLAAVDESRLCRVLSQDRGKQRSRETGRHRGDSETRNQT